MAATPWVHESWTVKDGLPVNSINAILQDRTGYIWAATFDGLVRFDGLRFTVFNSANSEELPSNRIIQLKEGRDGSLWLATEQGHIVRFRAGRFTNIQFENAKQKGLSDPLDRLGGCRLGGNERRTVEAPTRPLCPSRRRNTRRACHRHGSTSGRQSLGRHERRWALPRRERQSRDTCSGRRRARCGFHRSHDRGCVGNTLDRRNARALVVARAAGEGERAATALSNCGSRGRAHNRRCVRTDRIGYLPDRFRLSRASASGVCRWRHRSVGRGGRLFGLWRARMCCATIEGSSRCRRTAPRQAHSSTAKGACGSALMPAGCIASSRRSSRPTAWPRASDTRTSTRRTSTDPVRSGSARGERG